MDLDTKNYMRNYKQIITKGITHPYNEKVQIKTKTAHFLSSTFCSAPDFE